MFSKIAPAKAATTVWASVAFKFSVIEEMKDTVAELTSATFKDSAIDTAYRLLPKEANGD